MCNTQHSTIPRELTPSVLASKQSLPRSDSQTFCETFFPLPAWWTAIPTSKTRCIRSKRRETRPVRRSIYPRTLTSGTSRAYVFYRSASATGAQSVCLLAQVAQPVASRPTEEQFWMNDPHGRRKPNAEFLREHFLREGRVTEVQALAILRQCTDVFTAEPNVLKVKSPVTGMSSLCSMYWL